MKGKVAIVTGAARGIGRACATALGTRGAAVLMQDTDSKALATAAEELRSRGVVVAESVGDVGDAADVRTAPRRVDATHHTVPHRSALAAAAAATAIYVPARPDSAAAPPPQRRQVKRMVRDAAALGGLDVVVANAGIVKSADFLDMTEADFDAVIRTNLKGTFLTCQARASVAHCGAVPHLACRRCTCSQLPALA